MTRDRISLVEPEVTLQPQSRSLLSTPLVLDVDK